MVQQTRASGGGKPTLILTPSASEGSAVSSFILQGVEKRGMQGNQKRPRQKTRGDRRLFSKLKRSL